MPYIGPKVRRLPEPVRRKTMFIEALFEVFSVALCMIVVPLILLTLFSVMMD